MRDNPEGDELDPAEGVCRRCKKNSFFVLSCISNKTRESCDRGSEVGTVHCERDGEGPVSPKRSQPTGQPIACQTGRSARWPARSAAKQLDFFRSGHEVLDQFHVLKCWTKIVFTVDYNNRFILLVNLLHIMVDKWRIILSKLKRSWE